MEPNPTISLIKNMLRVNVLHKSLIDKQAKGNHIHRNQYLLLIYLSRCPAPPSQKDIAERLRISPAAVTDAIKKMEKLGLVMRSPSPDDTRVKHISLTEKGLAVMAENRQRFAQIDTAMVEGIGEEELAVFSSVLSKMTDNLLQLGAQDFCCASAKDLEEKEGKP